MSDAVSGATMSTSQLAAAYQAKILSLQKSAMKQGGEEALKLIESAVNPAGVGGKLDVYA